MKYESPIVLTLKPTAGIYATDEQGNPWATFRLHNDTCSCALCGKQIMAGWVRGKFGEEQMYVCSEHIEIKNTVAEATLND